MNEESYSAYMKWQSNYSSTWALFSGFTFTAINIILTQFPDPSEIRAQITLFILTILLDTFLLQLYSRRYIIQNCVRIAPSLPRMPLLKATTFLAEHLCWVLLGVAVVLMFLLWNLLYLASASGVAGMLFIIFAYTTYVKPFNKLFKERPFIRK